MPWCGSPFRVQGMKRSNFCIYAKDWQNPQCTASHRALSWVATSHSPMFCPLQNFVTGVSHKSINRPSLPPPAFHTNARFSHRLSSTPRHIEQFSNIQSCTFFDHNLKAFSCICSTTRWFPFFHSFASCTVTHGHGTRWFHWCKMGCHGCVQSMLPGGSTTRHKSLRQCTSSFRSSYLYNLR